MRKSIRSQDKQAEIDFFSKEPQVTPDSAHKDILKMLLSVNGFLGEMTSLDAGCGSGYFGVEFAKQGHFAVGSDISLEMLKYAREHAAKEGVDFSPVLCDLEKTPFRSEIFDLAFCGGVLHHFPDISFVTSELLRITKKGGRIFAIEPNGLNPVNVLKVFVRYFFPKNYLRLVGYATPNERPHTIKTYLTAFNRVHRNYQVDFRSQHFEQPFYMKLRNPLDFLIIIRNFLQKLLGKVLPHTLRGGYVTLLLKVE